MIARFPLAAGLLLASHALAQSSTALPSPAEPPTSMPAPSSQPPPQPLTHDPLKQFVGIVSPAGIADVRVTAAPDDFAKVEVVLRVVEPDGTLRETSIPMRRDGSEYVARVKAGAAKFTYLLRGTRTSGEVTSTTPIETRVAPVPHTPDWAKGAVWYQIFPERYRNGNPTNDPMGPAVFLADWNANWYEVQPGEMEAWKARRGIKEATEVRRRPGGALYNVIFDRRYGGDLQGIVEKMDELQDLGITALYLNPIFEAESLHKYDASDFRHIDERLAKPAEAGPARVQDGTYSVPLRTRGMHKGKPETEDPTTWEWTPADRYFVDVFLPEAKKRGIRVILDGVWNHTGKQFWAFQDIVKNGRNSKYADWYICKFDDNGALESWTGWPGRKNGDLPEFRQVRGGLTRERDETVERGDLNQGIKEHIFDVTRRWMDPNGDGIADDGIDGWRVDVAGEVGEQFWRDWRRLVKSINPDAIIIAEIWSKVDALGGASGFDTQMNYPFAYPVLNWITNMQPRENWKMPPEPFESSQLSEALRAAFKDAPQTNLIHQNLFVSHDTARYVSMLQNPGRHYDRDAEIQNGHGEPRPNDPDYIPFVEALPPKDVYRTSILGVAIQATYVGSPMIYYGDEYGMWGADDPNDRKPVPWADKGSNKNPTDQLIPEVREQYRYWLRLRQDPAIGEVLRFGDVQHLDSGSPDVFAFARSLNHQRVVVIINRGPTDYDAGALLSKPTHDALVPPLTARLWND